MMRAFRNLVLAALAFAGASGVADAAIISAIEYYDAALDHYFVTALPVEIAALDGGQFPGWARTGLSFNVYAEGSAVAGFSSVCRFYGSPAAGLDSHFYTASALECQQVLARFPGAWLLESYDVLEVFLPDLNTGQCPAGSIPIYRAWNQRIDSNHRYTTDASVLQAMVAKGYVAEGYGPGPTPTAMCSPVDSSSGGGVPVCTLTASDTAPFVGATITLYASCTGSPSSFTWTGCSSGGGRCVTAACSNIPTGYNWGNCASETSLCEARSAAAGLQTYSVSASNAGGTGPAASTSLNWQATTPTPPGLCGQYPSYLFSDLGWVGALIHSRDFADAPGFAWNGVWVVKLSIPVNATSTQAGQIVVVEYGGPPTSRELTISRVPCDFRPDDPTGNNGPLVRSDSTGPTESFVLGGSSGGGIGLMPGVDYYVNIRNWQVESSSISCDPSILRCDALFSIQLP